MEWSCHAELYILEPLLISDVTWNIIYESHVNLNLNNL